MKFISEHAKMFPINTMSNLLGVSAQGWRKYQLGQQQPGKRQLENQLLLERIKTIRRTSRGNYGSPRITLQLHNEGNCCGHNRIARIMREEGIQGKVTRRYRVRTTQSDHDYAVAANLAAQMEVSAPNQLWHADITYIATRQGWSYLAAVLDSYTRKIVGWSVKQSLKTELVLSALNMALKQQRAPRGLVHHSDRGIQYASKDYRLRLQRAGIRASMSRKGNCYDNATMESFFGTLKREQIEQTIYEDDRHARLEVFSYIEGFYNPCRIHTSLGGLSPVQMERKSINNTQDRAGSCSHRRLRRALDAHSRRRHEQLPSPNGN